MEAASALAELVACKDLKERMATCNAPDNLDMALYTTLKQQYQHRQPRAWARARAALVAIKRAD